MPQKDLSQIIGMSIKEIFRNSSEEVERPTYMQFFEYDEDYYENENQQAFLDAGYYYSVECI